MCEYDIGYITKASCTSAISQNTIRITINSHSCKSYYLPRAIVLSQNTPIPQCAEGNTYIYVIDHNLEITHSIGHYICYCVVAFFFICSSIFAQHFNPMCMCVRYVRGELQSHIWCCVTGELQFTCGYRS